jgi:uncharacterized protein YndB with AHSA1/START domain
MSLTIADQTVIHNTFVIERTYPATPERVFAAFADPTKKRRWFAESASHDIEEFQMDFRIGGTESARFRFKEGSPLKGAVITSDTSFQDIVPNRRVVTTSTMTLGGKLISAALATFELLPAKEGTVLIFTHQAAFFEGADGPKMREDGWRKLLDRLANELTT